MRTLTLLVLFACCYVSFANHSGSSSGSLPPPSGNLLRKRHLQPSQSGSGQGRLPPPPSGSGQLPPPPSGEDSEEDSEEDEENF